MDNKIGNKKLIEIIKNAERQKNRPKIDINQIYDHLSKILDQKTVYALKRVQKLFFQDVFPYLLLSRTGSILTFGCYMNYDDTYGEYEKYARYIDYYM